MLLNSIKTRRIYLITRSNDTHISKGTYKKAAAEEELRENGKAK